ncbi:MAG: SRPBCC family protein [Armatimonadota bacterium]|nr:SRPBCC family protein [Armatimonadota bacterium]
MDRRLSVISGLGLGAGLMYILDPDRGRRRRAMARDKAVHLVKSARHATDVTARDLANRARGLVAESKSMFSRQQVLDDVLEERIRAKLGRIVSHPGSIEIHAQNGEITVGGHVLSREADKLISTISRIRGVKGVENQLEAHEQAEDIPDLQGVPAPRGGQFELAQEHWSPAARFLVGGTGGALTLYGIRRGGLLGGALGLAGVGMLARAATNTEIKRLLAMGVGRCGVDVHKTLNIDAPIEEVFRFWTDYENFPQFMEHIREAHDLGEGRSHWTGAGPSGIPVSWNAEVTQSEPNSVIAWKSVPGSTVESEGIVRFDSNADGSTHVDVQMSYRPPAGAVGHAVAALFGADPKRQMDEDLGRMKNLIEREYAPRKKGRELEIRS